MAGGNRGRGPCSGSLEQSLRVSSSAGGGVAVLALGGGWATARVKAQRRVTATTATLAISNPRAARLVPPLQKRPSPQGGCHSWA
jgi:hypothetical protein